MEEGSGAPIPLFLSFSPPFPDLVSPISLSLYIHQHQNNKSNSKQPISRSTKMPQPLSLHVPRLLPITRTWTLPFTLYYLILSSRVVSERIKTEIYSSDSSSSSSSTAATSNTSPAASSTKKQGPGLATLRVIHANFVENVPWAFVLCAVAELNGANRKMLNSAMAGLLLLRVAHADGGLMLEGKFVNFAFPLFFRLFFSFQGRLRIQGCVWRVSSKGILGIRVEMCWYDEDENYVAMGGEDNIGDTLIFFLWIIVYVYIYSVR